MAVSLDAATEKPIVFRNNWIFVSLVFLAWLLFVLLALSLLIATIVNIFPLAGYNYDRVESLFLLLSLSVAAATFALKLWTVARKMSHCAASLDSRGVDFLLGTKKNPLQQFFAWSDISSVQRNASRFKLSYTVLCKDGRSLEFNMLNFFRPAALAHQIAAHVGHPIQQIKS
jgi:hypothetical protein